MNKAGSWLALALTSLLASSVPVWADNPAAAATSAATPTAPASASASAPLHIGLSVSDLGNPFFIEIAKGAEDEAKRLYNGTVSLQMVSSAYDEQRQIQQIDAFIQQHMDLILVVANSPHGLSEAITRARSASIPVLAIDVAAVGADLSITTNNRQAGEIACQYLAEQLGFHGKVVILNGPPVASVIERVAGCMERLQQHPAIEVLSNDRNGGGSRQGGLEVMTHLLTAWPDIDGAFAINDPTALGAEQAANLSGRKFMLVSVDGSPIAREHLKDPNSLLIATASQSPDAMARTAIREGLAQLQGQTAQRGELLLPSELITRENVGQFQTW